MRSASLWCQSVRKLFSKDQSASLPALTAVITRCVGGNGGFCQIKPMSRRKPCRSRPDSAQGSLPNNKTAGCERHSLASTLSSEVLPAPLGPIMANCSPASTCSEMPSKMVAPPSCKRIDGASMIELNAAGSLQQTGFARGRFDALIILRLGGDKAAGALQFKNFRVSRIFWVQR